MTGAPNEQYVLNSMRAFAVIRQRMKPVALGCLVSLLSAGCVVHYAPPPPPPPPSHPPPIAPGSAAPEPVAPPPGVVQAPPSRVHAPESQCGPAIGGLNELAHPGAMLLLADIPGTEQIPDFASDAACRQAESGMSVFVGLEIPEQEQSRLDEFLHSGGAEADRARLLGGNFWRRREQDGRSSKAVLQLVDDIRQMIHQGYRVTAFGYDASRNQGADRNAAMAENIEAWRERAPDGLFLVLEGSGRVGGGTGSAHQPLRAHLQRKERWLTSLAVAFEGGTAWTCEGPSPQQIQCAAHAIRGQHPGPFPLARTGPRDPHERFVTKWRERTPDGRQGLYYVGRLTASPPAVIAGTSIEQQNALASQEIFDRRHSGL